MPQCTKPKNPLVIIIPAVIASVVVLAVVITLAVVLTRKYFEKITLTFNFPILTCIHFVEVELY